MGSYTHCVFKLGRNRSSIVRGFKSHRSEHKVVGQPLAIVARSVLRTDVQKRTPRIQSKVSITVRCTQASPNRNSGKQRTDERARMEDLNSALSLPESSTIYPEGKAAPEPSSGLDIVFSRKYTMPLFAQGANEMLNRVVRRVVNVRTAARVDWYVGILKTIETLCCSRENDVSRNVWKAVKSRA